MKFFALLPALLLSWPLVKIARRGWRLFALLFFAALITGCASPSSSFEPSPCACNFEPLNTGNFEGGGHA